ncbi:MAG: hypothetical protein ACRD29_18380 [Acidimicrobiales bacterium]
MRRFVRALLATVVFIGMAGSERAAASASAPRPQPTPVGTENRPLDDRLASVAAAAPSFGGMAVNETTGALDVFVVNQEASGDVRRALEAEFAADGVAASSMHVVPAQFGLIELDAWHDRLTALFDVAGVVYTDLNEGRNRLEVGVTDASVPPQIDARLVALGIPTAAVVYTVTEPVTTLLHDRHRPLVGGLQISFVDGGTFLCTYGFTAVRANVGGYVVNSHCTRERGPDSTPHYQPVVAGSNRFGHEVVDPAFFTGGECPGGRVCRFSDASWGDRDGGVDARRRIARPALGSTDWNGNRSFRISAKGDAVQGVTVQKVGRTTGRSRATVSNTCVDVGVSGTNIVMLCQDLADLAPQGGDSGSPVFRVTNSPQRNDVHLAGILWGGSGVTAVISPISGIQSELGNLTVCAPEFGC